MGLEQDKPGGFSDIRCPAVRERSVCSERTKVMSVQSRQSVREPSEHGYGKVSGLILLRTRHNLKNPQNLIQIPNLKIHPCLRIIHTPIRIIPASPNPGISPP